MKEKVSEERTHREDYSAPAPAPAPAAVASTTSHSSSSTTTAISTDAQPFRLLLLPLRPLHSSKHSSRTSGHSSHQRRQAASRVRARGHQKSTHSLTDSLTLTSPATSSPSSTSFTLYLSSSSFFSAVLPFSCLTSAGFSFDLFCSVVLLSTLNCARCFFVFETIPSSIQHLLSHKHRSSTLVMMMICSLIVL